MSFIWCLRLICPPLIVWLLGVYSQKRLGTASELELVALSIISMFLIMIPHLRSGLIRRRLLIYAWMKRDSWLSSLLQGGLIYGIFKLIFAIPLSLLIIAELQHISSIEWQILVGCALIASATSLFLKSAMRRFLIDMPSSVLSREWGTWIFLILAIFILIPLILYLPRPDLHGLSLEQAFVQSSSSDQVADGIFGIIQGLSALKETGFWWLFLNLETILSGFPPWLISASQAGISLLYVIYSISFVYAFSRLISGLLEISDPLFYHFAKGYSLELERETQKKKGVINSDDLPSP